VACAEPVLGAGLAEGDLMALKLATAVLAAIFAFEAQSPAAVTLIHSWYDDKCCHDKDCRPVPCEEIEKISDGWLWRDGATKQRHWFPHDRLKASHDDACHVCVSPKMIPSGICIYLPLLA
jgi:hypothetical protein